METDHRPLVFIFGDKKGIPPMAASRVQRWSVFLSGYQYEIKHIKGTDNSHADCLSRLNTDNLKEELENGVTDDYSYLNYFEEQKLVSRETIQESIENDRIIKEVLDYTLNGWPKEVREELNPFQVRRNELTIENGCLMWGHRVTVPIDLRGEILKNLHSSHMGIVRMKALARSYVWWPRIDHDIESIIRKCETCLINSKDNPPKSELHVWEWPEAPNERIHVDFLGPLGNQMYIAIIDSHSKWIDIREMKNITTESTIDVLRDYFSTWGIPLRLVSDNGPAFCSELFKKFVTNNGIQHVRTAPYHPASNGAAENTVKTFKNKFKLLLKDGLSKKEALAKYLFHYRSSPHCTTGVSPAELQIGRKLRTRWDLLKVGVGETVMKKQMSQSKFFRGHRNINFEENEVVMAKDYRNNNWKKSEVIEKLSPVTYSVNVTDSNTIWKRHLDQLKPCSLGIEKNSNLNSHNKKQDCNDDNPLEIRPNVNISENFERSVSRNHNVNEPIIGNDNSNTSVICNDNLKESVPKNAKLDKTVPNIVNKRCNSPKTSNGKHNQSTNVQPVKSEIAVPLRRSTRTSKPRVVLNL